jgi:hypothetical protein
MGIALEYWSVAKLLPGAICIVAALPAYTAAQDPPQHGKRSELQCSVPADEMQVLTSYLKWEADARSVTVLVTTTDTSDIDIDYVNLLLAVRGLGTPPEARQDLKRKNSRGCAINAVPEIRNLRLISQRENDAMFSRRTAWADFHKSYGKDARLVTISRVGFNPDKHVALFYATGGLGPMAGSCYLYVFELRNGKWVKQAEAPAWFT